MTVTDEQYEQIEKKLGWLIPLWRKGQLVPLSYVKSKKIQEDCKGERKEGVYHMIYNKKLPLDKMSFYPKEKKILIDLSEQRKSSGIRLAIQVIVELIPPEEIYMYDPIGTNQGYKWYKGQPVIVYQILPGMLPEERMKVRKEVNSKQYDKYMLEDTWRIILQRDKGEIEGYKRYEMRETNKPLRIGIVNAFNGIQNVNQYIDPLTGRVEKK